MPTRRDQITAISDAWHKQNPGWNTAPARRELAAIAINALEVLDNPDHRRRSLLSPQDFLPLDQWGRQLTEAFHETPYLVGSAGNGKKGTYRDVDVRMLCPKGASWITRTETRRLTINLAVTSWGRNVTGLPIDFQFQGADEFHSYDYEYRSALGISVRSRLSQESGDQTGTSEK